METTAIGLDLAKTVFQVHGVDSQGKVVLARQLRRGQVSECVVGMEACATASDPSATKRGPTISLCNEPASLRMFQNTSSSIAGENGQIRLINSEPLNGSGPIIIGPFAATALAVAR